MIQNSRYSSELSKGDEYIAADMTDEKATVEAIKKIKSQYGRLDVLICNVGSGRSIPNKGKLEDYWLHYIKINLLSAAFLIQSAMDILSENSGRVVAISSICAENPRIGAPLPYSVSKAALHMLIKSLAAQNGRTGVRLNAVSPGNVYFEGSVWDMKLKDDEDSVRRYISNEVPLENFILPEDIAEAVSYLISDKAKNVTGVILEVDGGQSL